MKRLRAVFDRIEQGILRFLIKNGSPLLKGWTVRAFNKGLFLSRRVWKTIKPYFLDPMTLDIQRPRKGVDLLWADACIQGDEYLWQWVERLTRISLKSLQSQSNTFTRRSFLFTVVTTLCLLPFLFSFTLLFYLYYLFWSGRPPYTPPERSMPGRGRWGGFYGPLFLKFKPHPFLSLHTLLSPARSSVALSLSLIRLLVLELLLLGVSDEGFSYWGPRGGFASLMILFCSLATVILYDIIYGALQPYVELRKNHKKAQRDSEHILAIAASHRTDRIPFSVPPSEWEAFYRTHEHELEHVLCVFARIIPQLHPVDRAMASLCWLQACESIHQRSCGFHLSHEMSLFNEINQWFEPNPTVKTPQIRRTPLPSAVVERVAPSEICRLGGYPGAGLLFNTLIHDTYFPSETLWSRPLARHLLSQPSIMTLAPSLHPATIRALTDRAYEGHAIKRLEQFLLSAHVDFLLHIIFNVPPSISGSFYGIETVYPQCFPHIFKTKNDNALYRPLEKDFIHWGILLAQNPTWTDTHIEQSFISLKNKIQYQFSLHPTSILFKGFEIGLTQRDLQRHIIPTDVQHSCPRNQRL